MYVAQVERDLDSNAILVLQFEGMRQKTASCIADARLTNRLGESIMSAIKSMP